MQQRQGKCIATAAVITCRSNFSHHRVGYCIGVANVHGIASLIFQSGNGRQQWLKEQEHEEIKMQSVLVAYKARCGESEGKDAIRAPPEDGNTNTKFCCATYQEAYTITDEIIYDDEGELMHAEEFHDFSCESTRFGKLTRAQSQEKWNRWKENLEVLGLVHDYQGPKDSPLRIRISTKDKVICRKKFSMTKELKIMLKAIKKVKQSDLDTMQSDLFTGKQQPLTGMEATGFTQTGLAQTMLTSVGTKCEERCTTTAGRCIRL